MWCVLSSMKTLCFVWIIAIHDINAIHFHDCGSKAGHVTSVDLIPCPSEPCLLKEGTNITIKANFIAKTMSERVTAVVYGIIGGMPVPLPVVQPDACQAGIHCPVKPGSNNHYQQVIYIDQTYPQIQLTLKYELKDDQGQDFVCFTVPIKLTY